MSSTITFSPSTVSKILKYKKKLEKVNMDNESKVLTYLKKVENLRLDQALLSETKIGITVNRFRRKKGPVANAAARIIENWTEMVKRNFNAGPSKSTEEDSADRSQSMSLEMKKAAKPRAPSPVHDDMRSQKDQKRPKEKPKATRQSSVAEGVSASSGLSFAELMSAGDCPKKRKARAHADSGASLPKKPKLPPVTDADIRASLSQPNIDYCDTVQDVRRSANGSPSKVAQQSDDIYAPLKLNSRSVVYSGRSRGQTVMSLKESCLNVLYHHVDEVGPMGEGVVFHVVQSFLERLTVPQLERIERWNNHFVPDDDILWERHCRREFKSCREIVQGPKKRQTWRQLYFHLREDKERRLFSLTSAINANKEKATEGERKAKIAFANSTPKAPRDVRRQQAKFGTNRFDAMEHADPKRISEGVTRKFVAPEPEPLGGVVVKANQKKKSNQMKKLISSIKRVGYRH